jgi:hypothetical protein
MKELLNVKEADTYSDHSALKCYKVFYFSIYVKSVSCARSFVRVRARMKLAAHTRLYVARTAACGIVTSVFHLSQEGLSYALKLLENLAFINYTKYITDKINPWRYRL